MSLWRGRGLLYLCGLWLGSSLGTGWLPLSASLLTCVGLITVMIITELASLRGGRLRRACCLAMGVSVIFIWGGARTKAYEHELNTSLQAWRVRGLSALSHRPLQGAVRALKRRGDRWSALLELTPPEGLSGLGPLMALYRSDSLAPEIAEGAQVWLTPPLSSIGSLTAPLPAPEPLAFDQGAHLLRQGASVYARGELWLSEAGPACHSRLKLARERLRERLSAKGERGRVALALTLGDAAQLSSSRSSQARRLGIAHLFAVSGLHIGGVALLFGLLFRRVARALGSPRPGRIGLIAALFGAWAVTLAVGCPLSALRASLMVSALSVARLVGVPLSPLGSLIIAGYLLTLMSPWRSQELSFQLSWGAVFGLCVLSPRCKRPMLTALSVSLSASLATAPLIAWSFSVYSPFAPLTNLLITPLMTITALPICLLGGCSMMALLTLPAEGGALSVALEGFEWLACAGAQLLIWAVDLSPEALELGLTVGRAGALLLGVTCLLWWVLCSRLIAVERLRSLRLSEAQKLTDIWGAIIVIKLGRAPLLLTSLVLLGGLCLRAMSRPPPPSVTTLSVGQGDASLLMSGEGELGLFDVGPRAGGRVISELLRRRGVSRLDWVAVSHLHPDHYEGLRELLERVEVAKVIYHGRDPRGARHDHVRLRAQVEGSARGGSWAELRSELARLGVPLVEAQPGRQAWGGLLLEWGLTHPPAGLKENDASLSLFVSPINGPAPLRGLLLSGDLEKRGERRLTALWPEGRRAYLWQADHHGSDTSSGAEVLAQLKPRVSLMSLGAGNRYGFPHPEVIARLHKQGASWLRTDLEGHITAEWGPEGELRLTGQGEGLPSW